MKPTPGMLARLEEMLLEAERDLRFAQGNDCVVAIAQKRVDTLRGMLVFRDVPPTTFSPAFYRL